MKEEEVCHYLETHPDFFLKHPGLLPKLELPVLEQGLPSLPLLRLQQLRGRLGDCQGALQEERYKQDIYNRRCRAMQQLAIEFLYIQTIDELADSIDSVCSDEMSVSKATLRFWQAAAGISTNYLLPKISESTILQRLDSDGFFWGSPPNAEKNILLHKGSDLSAFVLASLYDAQHKHIGVLIFAGQEAELLNQELDRSFLRFCRDLIQQMMIKCLHFSDLIS